MWHNETGKIFEGKLMLRSITDILEVLTQRLTWRNRFANSNVHFVLSSVDSFCGRMQLQAVDAECNKVTICVSESISPCQMYLKHLEYVGNVSSTLKGLIINGGIYTILLVGKSFCYMHKPMCSAKVEV